MDFGANTRGKLHPADSNEKRRYPVEYCLARLINAIFTLKLSLDQSYVVLSLCYCVRHWILLHNLLKSFL